MSMWRNAAGKPVSARNEKMWFEPTVKRDVDVVISTMTSFGRPSATRHSGSAPSRAAPSRPFGECQAQGRVA